MGVPHIGCPCPVCNSFDPKNQRLRSAGLIKIGNKTILLDVGPDIRTQALREGLERLDGLIITHSHYDHVAGLDDLRIFYYHQKRALPTLCNKECYLALRQSHSYLFHLETDPFSKSDKFAFQVHDQDFGATTFCGIKIQALSYFQGKMKVMGLRIGSFAYLSDIKEYSEELIEKLIGVKTLVVSALRHDESPVHFNLDEALAFCERVNPEKVYFTHIAHDLDHETTQKELPESVYLSYDGLEIPFDIGNEWLS